MLPPEPCPPEVVGMIEEASCLHNNGKYDEAVQAYYDAQDAWDQLACAGVSVLLAKLT